MIAVIQHPQTGVWIQVHVNVPESLIQYWNNICVQDPEA